MNASNTREFSADALKTNDESLHRNLFGLAHLQFQMFNDRSGFDEKQIKHHN